ncbi:hypothetical protein MAR_036027, partial [Mya arenaria]
AAVSGWTAPGAITGADGSFAILAADAIVEDSPEGTALFTATATVGGTASYVLFDDAGGKGTIDATSGVVSLATGQTLNVATAATHDFIIVATDSKDSTVGSATITLPILNNEAPAYAEAQFTACVEDNSGAAGDTNSDFVYGTDGTLKVATSKTLEKSTMATYTLVLHATDAGPLTGSSTVTLSVESTCSGVEAFGAMFTSVLLSAIVSYLI